MMLFFKQLCYFFTNLCNGRDTDACAGFRSFSRGVLARGVATGVVGGVAGYGDGLPIWARTTPLRPPKWWTMFTVTDGDEVSGETSSVMRGE